ncbi:MAG: hypothetical protein QXS38_02420 [Candidatus Pacearchaeota archaeon]
MNKSIGYIISGIGIIVLLLSFVFIRNLIGITFPAGLTDLYLMLIGLALVVVGGFLIYKTAKETKLKEVPIYQEKEVVGFRRIEE